MLYCYNYMSCCCWNLDSIIIEQGKPLQYHHLTDIDRVFCLSDLHTDHVDNLKWLSDQLTASSSSLTARDLVIVAGDISHEFAVFEKSLDLLLDHATAVAGCSLCPATTRPG